MEIKEVDTMNICVKNTEKIYEKRKNVSLLR
jgi:hypothetical protein